MTEQLADEQYGDMFWGTRPDDVAMMAPLKFVQDPSLSLRAKGLMVYMLSLPKGASLSADSLYENTQEGRAAVATTLKELEAAGYIVRSRRQTEGGQWISRTDLLPFGNRRPANRPPVDRSTVNRTPVDRGSVDRRTVSRPPVGRSISPKGSESSTEVEVAAATSQIVESETREASSSEAIDHHASPVEDVPTGGPGVTERHTIPWTEVHLLRSWFRVEEPQQVDAWQQAWMTATATNGETGYDVQTDLNAYLVRCRAEKRQPSAALWLRFLIQDRAKWVSDQRHHEELQEQRAAADGGQEWALRSLNKTPQWDIDITEGRQQ